jgi:glycosyltransferase involved in cell wall biosynthesis
VRVLYFHQYFSTVQGATGTRSYEMARQLVESGHQVTMVCGSAQQSDTGLTGPFVGGRRSGDVDGIRVIELAIPYSNHDGFVKRSAAFLSFALRSVRIALSAECDVVFATSTPLTAGIPGIFARWLRGKPFVFEVRDLWPELPRAMGVITNPLTLLAMSALEWASYKSAHRLIGLAPGIVEGIVRRGIPPGRVAMIPNGCDLELFTPVDSQGGEGLLPGIRDGDFVTAFTGAHGIANGLDAVLDAAAVLAARGADRIKFVFVGDGRMKPALVERARRDGLTNCVFLNPMPKQQLASAMGRVDVGLMILANVPEFYRGTSPNKFFDYIAAGMPVLVNYPGWLADLIAEHGCGVVVPPDDPVAFAEALLKIAGGRKELLEQGMRARALAEARFDRAVLGRRWVRVIEEAAGMRDPHAAVTA